MSDILLVQTYYEAARNEVLQRMKLRDNALLVYLAFVGALLGVALSSSNNIEILLSIPFLALGISIIVSQHNIMSTILSQYCSNELAKLASSCSSNNLPIPQWDNSDEFKKTALSSSSYRLFGHGLIILAPCVLSLGINWRHPINGQIPFSWLWIIGVICSIIIVYVIWNSSNRRATTYVDRTWFNE